MSGPLFVQVPAVPSRRIAKLAFYTTGDTTPVTSEHLTITTEEMWRRRAETLAPGRAHGVATVQDALAVVTALEPDVILDEVFFLGHGSGEDFGFFFFSGRPDRVDHFVPTSFDQLLEMSRAEMRSLTPSPTKTFLIELFKRLARADPRVPKVKINFLACFMGQGETHLAVCDFLDGWLVGPREVLVEVGAYTDYYETVFRTVRGGRIAFWEDHIVDKPLGTEIIPSPGRNLIPPFQVGCPGRTVMVRTPFLFETTNLYSAELDAGTISEDLRLEFGLKRHELSISATVQKTGEGRWEILDHENGFVYRVVQEGVMLKVFMP